MTKHNSTAGVALPATASEAHRLADEFYNGTAEKDWPAWAQETVVILERAAASGVAPSDAPSMPLHERIMNLRCVCPPADVLKSDEWKAGYGAGFHDTRRAASDLAAFHGVALPLKGEQ